MIDCTANHQQMKKRTKVYLAHVSAFCRESIDHEAGYIRDQLFRASFAVAAHYRSACHASSKSDFISRLGIVLEEADKSLYWLDALLEKGQADSSTAQSLMKEGSEIVSILVFSLSSTRIEPKRFRSYQT